MIDVKKAAKIYALLEKEEEFAFAVWLYLELERVNSAQGQATAPMPELALAVEDWPLDLFGALANARASWKGGAS